MTVVDAMKDFLVYAWNKRQGDQGIEAIFSVDDAALNNGPSSEENVPLSQPVHIGREATPVAENDANELLHLHDPFEDVSWHNQPNGTDVLFSLG
ncbi:hypothetical protein FHG87_009676 [Trinorchestia longiramus]|nr:hypothetical protein FHG87_009676 [Trinorchestia longiramus]